MDQRHPHFSLEEFVHSQTAARHGIDNTPPSRALANLEYAMGQMERVRTLLGGLPITVSSGYRSPAVNAYVGGSPTSAHMTGHAVDFICPRFGTPLQICQFLAESGLPFDQLIQEGTWVHIAFGPGSRRQLLTKDGNGFTPGIGVAKA